MLRLEKLYDVTHRQPFRKEGKREINFTETYHQIKIYSLVPKLQLIDFVHSSIYSINTFYVIYHLNLKTTRF